MIKGRRWDLITKGLRNFEIKQKKLQNVEDLELGKEIKVTVIYIKGFRGAMFPVKNCTQQ